MLPNRLLSKPLGTLHLCIFKIPVRTVYISSHAPKAQGSTAQYELLFVFVALRPMSTAMVIAGRSVHLTTLFPGQA